MSDEQANEPQPVPSPPKKIVSMLAIIIVLEALLSIIALGLLVTAKRMQGDIAKMTVLLERQYTSAQEK